MQCLGPADCQMLCFCNTTFYILLHSNCLLIFLDGGVWWSCPRLRGFFSLKTRAHVTRVSSSSWHFFSSCRHLASTEAVGACWCCLGRGWVNKASSTDEIPQVVSRTILCFSQVFMSLGGNDMELQYHISLTWICSNWNNRLLLNYLIDLANSSHWLQPLAVHQHKSSCQLESQRPGDVPGPQLACWNFTSSFPRIACSYKMLRIRTWFCL